METTPLISNKLLQLLICPVCGCGLVIKGNELYCETSDTSFEIVDGIPIMIPK